MRNYVEITTITSDVIVHAYVLLTRQGRLKLCGGPLAPDTRVSFKKPKKIE